MNTLIIGASGFVGQYLINAVRQDIPGEIIVTKRASSKSSFDGVETANLDIMNEEEIESLLAEVRPAYIFHLAAQSSVALSWEKPGMTTDINVKGSLNLMNAVRKTVADSTRVLMVGSGEEYGFSAAHGLPLREDELVRPGNVYAVTKACQNYMASVYSEAYHLQIVMARAFNHIGPGQKDTFVVSNFCRQVAEIELGIKEPILRVGNLSAQRDFTDVRDVVKAYTKLVQFGRRGQTYNVGRGQAVSISAILETILSKAKTSVQVEIDPQRMRPADVPIIVPDVSKIYRDTGWKAEIPLEQTIEDVLNEWRNRLGKERSDV